MLERCFVIGCDVAQASERMAFKIGFGVGKGAGLAEQSIIAVIVGGVAEPAAKIAHGVGERLTVGDEVPSVSLAFPAWRMSVL